MLAQALALAGAERDEKLAEVSEALRLRMEADAFSLKDLVLAQPPHDLLGYFWSLLHMNAMQDSEGVGRAIRTKRLTGTVFLRR